MSAILNNMQISVVAYTLQRLADLGIDRVFGVPGDYSFPINDAVEEDQRLSWVASANELNAAYAADGYARRRGAAILSTTYGVGELSALNGVMGAMAERVPVFHIVGAPSTRIVKQGLVAHHTLGDGIFGNFEPLSAAACCVTARLSPENVVLELERVIDKALEESQPAYLVIPMDLALMPVIGIPLKGSIIGTIRQRQSDPGELNAALTHVLNKLAKAKNPIVLATRTISRFGLKNTFEKFLESSGLPYATSPMDRAILSESHPGYLGVYSGDMSQPAVLKQIIQESDLVLDIGGLIHEDLNTGIWTDGINTKSLVSIRYDWVQSCGSVFTSVALQDMLDGLIDAKIAATSICYWNENRPVQPPAFLKNTGTGTEQITAKYFYPLLQNFLRSGDVLVLEAGSCMLQISSLRLPDGVDMENQTLWSSIGWATPAAMGVAMAQPEKRVVLLSGDGAHQLTAQEIGVMGRYGVKPVVIILNNSCYGIEDMLSDRNHEYNILAPWSYSKLPITMGCENWWCARVESVAELETALKEINVQENAAYLEVVVPASDSKHIAQAIVDRLQKQHTPPDSTEQ
jgi:indolepyruvate decarboxylase